MAREDFILNVRNAARFLTPAKVESNGRRANPNTVAAVLDNAERWLSPASVSQFEAEDFPDVSPKTRDSLQQDIAEFLEVSQTVSVTGSATKSQSRSARRHLEKVIALVGEIVRTEWLSAVDTLYRDLERWSRNRQSEVKKDQKEVVETLLGAYTVPRLLIHGPEGRLLIDPIARFAAGCDGLVEIAVLPSYDSAKLIRVQDQWFLNPLGSSGERHMLNESRFQKVVKKLIELA